MTENRKFISSLCLVLVLLLAGISGLRAEVYQWVGGSGQWSDQNHWMIDGSTATALPGLADNVFVYADQDLSIAVDIDAHIASLTIAGQANVDFVSNVQKTITVEGSLLLTNQTTVSDEIQVELLGTTATKFKQYERAEAHNITEVGGPYVDLLAAGGGCPFFTLVENPTPPTCNGMNDGIAEILEPVDGIGPYSYQWIGGPSTAQWANVGAGTYTVIVIDIGQGGLPCNKDVFVNEPGPLTVFSMNANPPLCADVCNGTAAPIVIGGNGGFTYTWSSGESGIAANQLCPVFNLVVEDQLGCTLDTTYTFPNPPDTIKFNAVISDVDCFGDDNGSIDMSISGGAPGFTVSWTGPNGFVSSAEDISGLEPGDYTISVEDTNACLVDSIFTIAENSLMDATAQITDNVCGGGFIGEIDLSPIGGVSPYAYAWVGPNGFVSIDEDLTGLESGAYQVTITDAVMCTFVLNADVDEPTDIAITLTSVDLLCFEDLTGEITALAAGGSPGYTYDWTGPNGFVGAGTGLNGLEAGMYYITVTDVNLCAKLDSIEVFQPELLEVALVESPITCNNGSDGAIELNITGGTPNFTIAWSGPNGYVSSDEDISNLEAGQYNVEVIDDHNCMASGGVEITNPLPMTLTAAITEGTCSNSSNGSIDLTVAGGTPNFSYAWTGPNGFTSISEDISGLSPGNYSVTVTDSNICSANQSFDVPTPAALQLDFDVTDILCFGDNTGQILSTPSGGAGPYNYIWIGPGGFVSTDEDISNLIAGYYEVVMTDGNACVGIFNVTLLEEPEIIIDETVVDVSCFGYDDGSIDIAVSGGNPPYSSAWTGPNGFVGAGTSLNGIEAGMYYITVTDANVCEKLDSVEVFQPELFEVDLVETPITCNGGADGAIALNITGGTPNYTVTWSGPNGFVSNDEDISNLEPGQYDVDLVDANNCMVSGSLEIMNPPSMTLTAVITPGTCSDSNAGSIDLTVADGTPNYSYSWTGPNGFTSIDEDISGIPTGTYTVTVSDANNCTAIQSFDVPTPLSLQLDFDVTDILCFGDNTGQILSTPSGGTAPYNFIWIGPGGFISTDEDISNLIAGYYEVVMTDGNACVGIFNVTLLQEPEIIIDETVVDVSCFGYNDGSIDISVSGGNPPYSFSWVGPNGFTSIQQSLSNILAGTYDLEVTDAFDCVIPVSFDVVEPSEIAVSETITDVLCAGFADGSIEIIVNGMNPPFDFSWTGPAGFTSIDQDIFGLVGGTYDLTIEDDNGCQSVASYVVAETITLNDVIDIQHVSCFGADDGALTLTVTGGTEPYSIDWTGPNGFVAAGEVISNLEAGSYTVTVVDDNGCELVRTYIVDGPNELLVTIDSTQITCDGENDGTATAITAGGTVPITISWTGPNGFTSGNAGISNLEPGMYVVTVTDNGLCSVLDSVEMINPLPLILDVTVVQPSCLVDDGSLTALPSGGTITADYTYSWLDSFGAEISTLSSISNLAPGTYTIVVTDDNGCIIQQELELMRDAFELTESLFHVSCTGSADGAIDVEPTAGTPGFDYAWTGPNGFVSSDQNISGLESGDYNVFVTDQVGCEYNATYTITEPADISFASTTTPESCQGDADGSIDLVVSGGTPGYIVDWTGPNGFVANGLSLSGLEPGTYTATASDIRGCANFVDITVGVGAVFTIDGLPSNPLCANDFSGSIDISMTEVSGISAPFTFSWSGPNGFTSADEDLANLEQGIYNLVVTGITGCEETESFELMDPLELTLSTTFVNSNCQQADGSANAVGGGGTGNVSYAWTNALNVEVSNTADLIDVSSGTYTVTITDDNGCMLSEVVQISDQNGTVSGIIVDPTCNQGADGAIDISVVGGADPLTFEWSDENGVISDQEDLVNLTLGTYTVVVTDANGCLFSSVFQISNPEPIEGLPTVTPVSCSGNDGAINLFVSDGIPPYTIDWTGPNGFIGTGTNITGLEEGVYNFTISDASDCSNAGSVTVTHIPDVSVLAAQTNVNCGGAFTGALDLSVSGGNPPYAFAWTGPNGFSSTQEDIDALEAGVYDLIVTDGVSCSIPVQYEIIENPPIEATFTMVQPDCNLANGSISANIVGGVVSGNYFINWTASNGNAIPQDLNISNLDIGTYTLMVSDDNGCAYDTTITLSNPGSNITSTIIDLTCFTETEGSIQLFIADVQAPFDVAWTGPNGFTSLDQNIFSLESGFYTYEVTGADGCVFIETLEVLSPALIEAPGIVQGTCFGENSGAISVSVSGGIEPYSIGWIGPDGYVSTDTEIIDLAPGIYNLQVFDANTCLFTAAYEVIENPEITVAETIVDVVCHGASTGSIALTIGGGIPPISVAWTGPNGFISNDQNIENLAAGIYTVAVTDDSGCVVSANYEITEPDALTVISDLIPVGCATPGSLGEISLEIAGGVTDYTIVWTGPNGFVSNDEDLIDLESGVYTYLVTDANNCTVSGQEEVLEVNPIIIDLETTHISCHGELDGAIIATISGGMPAYTIVWSGPNGFASDQAEISDLESGTYFIQVVDDLGCTAEQTVNIIEPDELTLSTPVVIDASCNTTNDGQISIEVNGGTGPFTTTWTGPNGFTSDQLVISDLFVGDYTFDIVDINGCAAQSTATIDTPVEVFADAGNDVVVCEDVLPTDVVGSGTNADIFNWTNLDGDTLSTDAVLSIDESAGVYDFILIASNGLCENVDTLRVEVLSSPEVDAGEEMEVFAEDLFTLGGDPTSPTGVEYAWTPNTTGSLDTTMANPTGFILETTLFTVLVTDGSGCQNSDTVLVTLIPDVEISSGITPNGDGLNDIWIIDNMQLFPKSVVNVFDRWGIVVFEAKGYNASNAWDGTYKGDQLPVGTYYYTIELNDERFPNPFTGPITIYR